MNLTPEEKQAILDSPEAREMLDRLTNPVDLHPDLVERLEEHETLGTILRHPMVYGVPYSPTMNAMWNGIYEQKKKAVKEHLDNGQYGQVIFLFERAYRISTLLSLRDKFTDDAEFWRVFGYVYTDSENIGECQEEFEDLVETDRPGRVNMMKPQEQAVWEKLPDEITVFRGHKYVNELGYSWSLSYTKALWFARRHDDKDGGLVSGKVQKKDIIGFFHRRDEMDVLVHPYNVEDLWGWKVPPATEFFASPFQKEWDENGNGTWKYPKGELFHNLLLLTSKQFALDPWRTNHGPDHWMKVEHNGNQIADRIPEVDRDVVRAFAFIHDCKRENEHKDPMHGHRAADYMLGCDEIKNMLAFSPDQMEKLEHALRYHNDGQVSTDPTVGACWDADRLDLVRVCYVPNPKLFSTEAGRGLIFNV